MKSLPPLSGAILISNPRPDEMSSSKENPNNRRTINLIARFALDKEKTGSIEARTEKVAKKWFSERNKPSAKRKVSRTAMYGKAGTRGAKFKKQKGSVKKLRATSERRKGDYAVAKKVAAQTLAKLYKLKGVKAAEYVQRVLGAKGDAYISSDKKMSKSYFGGTRKGEAVNVKGVRSWNALKVERRAAGKWGHAHGRPGFRGKHPFAKKHAAAIKRAKATLKTADFKKVKLAKAEDWKMAKKSSKRKAGSTASRRRSGRKGSLAAKAMRLRAKHKISLKAAWKKLKGGKAAPARKHRGAKKSRRAARRNPEVSALMNPVSALMNPKRKRKHKKHTRRGRASSAAAMRLKHREGISLKAAWARLKGKKVKGKARKGRMSMAARKAAAFSNPRSARKNPAGATMALSLGSAKQYFVGYAVPVLLAGGAAGAVHAAARKYDVTAKVEEYAGKVPVIGEYLAKAPYTLQGAAVGSALAIIAPMVGGKAGEALALVGGAALIFGGGLDAFNIVGEKIGAGSVGDLAFGDLAFGDLAFGDLAGVGAAGFKMGSSPSSDAGSAPYGDGFAYELAPLTASLSQVDYGQASLHDAYYSGADFSEMEGQAILNGQSSFLEAFGAPPTRMGAKSAAQSHLAGRPGHRWGWLIKVVGFRKAQQIADLPPKQRIEVIRKIRAAALAAAQQGAVLDQAKQLAHEAQMSDAESAPVSGSAAQAASGASGASAMGDLAFGALALGDLALAGEEYGATLFAQS